MVLGLLYEIHKKCKHEDWRPFSLCVWLTNLWPLTWDCYLFLSLTHSHTQLYNLCTIFALGTNDFERIFLLPSVVHELFLLLIVCLLIFRSFICGSGFCCLCAELNRTLIHPFRCNLLLSWWWPSGWWADAAAAAATTIRHHCLYDTVRAIEWVDNFSSDRMS